MSDEVTVMWSQKVDLGTAYDMTHPDYRCLYMIIWKRWLAVRSRLLYIGRAYWQDPSERLCQHEVLDEILDDYGEDGIFVKFGELRPPGGRRISEQLVNDVETLLINWHQPEYNRMSTTDYWGRDLVVRNRGFRKPLDKTVDSDELD